MDPRTLGRATLARQLLLERSALAVVAAVDRIGGRQAQEGKPPFVGLWSRLAGFEAEQLRAVLVDRSVVRVTAMRATLHLVGAGWYRRLRPALQPMLAGAMRGVLKDRVDGLPMDRLLDAAREVLADGPRTFEDLRAALVERFPDADERAMGYAVRTQLPLVVVPGEGRWVYPPGAPFTLAEQWLGAEPDGDPDPSELVRAYLGAFGPATVADAQCWSGLKGLRPTFDRLRPDLVEWTSGRQTWFDLPDAPRPDPDTPAPPRFLPEFDDLVLAHDDRTRFLDPEDRGRLVTKNLRVRAAFLVDGRVAGTWTSDLKKKVATVRLEPFAPLGSADLDALEAEGVALARFLEPSATTCQVERGT